MLTGKQNRSVVLSFSIRKSFTLPKFSSIQIDGEDHDPCCYPVLGRTLAEVTDVTDRNQQSGEHWGCGLLVHRLWPPFTKNHLPR